MSTATQASTGIRPFHVDIPAEKIDDLRERIGATRWPSKELAGERSQGVQLAALQALARYWLDEYDFGRIEARLNALQFPAAAANAVILLGITILIISALTRVVDIRKEL